MVVGMNMKLNFQNCKFELFKDKTYELFRIGWILGKITQKHDDLDVNTVKSKIELYLKNNDFYIPFRNVDQFWYLDNRAKKANTHVVFDIYKKDGYWNDSNSSSTAFGTVDFHTYMDGNKQQ